MMFGRRLPLPSGAGSHREKAGACRGRISEGTGAAPPWVPAHVVVGAQVSWAYLHPDTFVQRSPPLRRGYSPIRRTPSSSPSGWVLAKLWLSRGARRGCPHRPRSRPILGPHHTKSELSPNAVPRYWRLITRRKYALRSSDPPASRHVSGTVGFSWMCSEVSGGGAGEVDKERYAMRGRGPCAVCPVSPRHSSR